MTSANSQQKSVSPEDQTVDGVDAKELQECEEYDASTVEDISAPASDEGSEEKEDDLKEGEVKKDKLRTSSIVVKLYVVIFVVVFTSYDPF